MNPECILTPPPTSKYFEPAALIHPNIFKPPFLLHFRGAGNILPLICISVFIQRNTGGIHYERGVSEYIQYPFSYSPDRNLCHILCVRVRAGSRDGPNRALRRTSQSLEKLFACDGYFQILIRVSSTIHKLPAGGSVKNVGRRRLNTSKTWALSCRFKRSTIKP